MLLLWRPAPPDPVFPTVAGWAADLQDLRAQFNGGTGPFPPALIATAEALFAELIPSQAAPVLLHGDLHHDNILAATRAPWLALDPKGVVGEPAYEAGALLRNQLARVFAAAAPAGFMARRVDQLAEALALDRDRLIGWSLAQAVLSAWWTYEDHGQIDEPMLACAALLATLRR
jgi:streptomycin 6-kinase